MYSSITAFNENLEKTYVYPREIRHKESVVGQMGGERKWTVKQRGERRGGGASTVCRFQRFASTLLLGVRSQIKKDPLLPGVPGQLTQPPKRLLHLQPLNHSNSAAMFLESKMKVPSPVPNHRICQRTFPRIGNSTEMSLEKLEPLVHQDPNAIHVCHGTFPNNMLLSYARMGCAMHMQGRGEAEAYYHFR